MGLTITIPLAMLSDFLTYAIVPTCWGVVGAVLVIAGFCVINADFGATTPTDENETVTNIIHGESHREHSPTSVSIGESVGQSQFGSSCNCKGTFEEISCEA